ncbi:antimicrobial peptide microplusin-like [Dermacentor silvarum]|uniref:antimicrobial peptide microplusin-like n=1 Tax=Dermacentor silvarum TaxID=543639 RepID=UPI00189B9120|nr:antimicrobial peptide microplusin-like [Dermacentor silvarum]
MKAAFVICSFVVIFVAAASAHHMELCGKSYPELVRELQCITGRISRRTHQAFAHAVWQLRCPTYACAIRRMCSYNDLERAMAYFFTRCQIRQIHNAATACDPNAHDHSGSQPSWWQGLFPGFGSWCSPLWF